VLRILSTNWPHAYVFASRNWTNAARHTRGLQLPGVAAGHGKTSVCCSTRHEATDSLDVGDHCLCPVMLNQRRDITLLSSGF
jgi:hypothetical protein